MKNLFILFSIIISVKAFAGGSMQISGVVRNFNSEKIEIEDDKKIYSIVRIKIIGSQKATIQKLRSGLKLNLTIPFDALTEVRLKK